MSTPLGAARILGERCHLHAEDRPPPWIMSATTLANALLRCTRADHAAAPVFDLVRSDLGLWVMELDGGPAGGWDGQISAVVGQIEPHRLLLMGLQQASTDFTLHLAVESCEGLSVRLPVRLSRLAAECGFEIEICSAGSP